MPLTQLATKIQQQADLVQIISAYLTLQEGRKALKGICPFHADHASSLMVSQDKNIFKCFGCGKEGGPVEFVMAIENVTYNHAVNLLATKFELTHVTL